jgi:acetyl-CoA carboxylase carboxyltransferase component
MNEVKNSVHDAVEDLKRRKEKAMFGGGQEKIDLLHKNGFQTARERIQLLADPDSFLELGMLNHSDYPGAEERSYGDGLITGLAKIDGRPAVIMAGDKTVFAGTEGAVHIRKSKKVHEYALKRGLPLFNLNEGGGLRMPDGMGSDGISDKLFPQEMLTHSRQVPLMTAIVGDSFGGPTWMAVSSDFVTMLKGTCMAIAGPRMLSMATGQKVNTEELGGWRVHAEETGQADSFGSTEEQCIEQLKTFFSYMPLNADDEPRYIETNDDPYRSAGNLLNILPGQKNRVYDMKEIIREIVDNQQFFEYKSTYGEGLVTVFSRMNGRVVGIVANQPKKFAGAAGPKECD